MPLTDSGQGDVDRRWMTAAVYIGAGAIIFGVALGIRHVIRAHMTPEELNGGIHGRLSPVRMLSELLTYRHGAGFGANVFVALGAVLWFIAIMLVETIRAIIAYNRNYAWAGRSRGTQGPFEAAFLNRDPGRRPMW